jgi:hypothetical protein
MAYDMRYDPDAKLTGSWHHHWSEKARKQLGIKAIGICANGHHGSFIGHKIEEDGRVWPSYVCPIKDCGWHEWVRLVNWPQKPPAE